MGVLHAAFLLAPLAMFKYLQESPLKCVLLAHTNGSVLASAISIKKAGDLVGKTIGIPHTKSTHRVLLFNMKHKPDEIAQVVEKR